MLAAVTVDASSPVPTVRQLAADLGLAVNTVARSYRELEAAGLVETRGRGGTVVTAGGDHARERLAAAADQAPWVWLQELGQRWGRGPTEDS